MIYYCAVLHKKKALSGAGSTLNRHIAFFCLGYAIKILCITEVFEIFCLVPKVFIQGDSGVLRTKRLGKNKNTSLKSLDLKLILLYSHIGISLELSVPDP